MRRRNAKNAHERVQARDGLMVLDPSLYKGKWRELFGNDNPIYLEIGMRLLRESDGDHGNRKFHKLQTRSDSWRHGRGDAIHRSGLEDGV